MRRITSIVAVLLMVVLSASLVGCQQAIESATKAGIEKATGVSTDGDSVTIKKDGEEVTLGGSTDGKLPEGFPSDFPMFDPITITSGMKASNGAKVTFTTTAKVSGKSFDEVTKFYADELKAKGWEVKQTGSMTGDTGVGSIDATKGTDKAAIQFVQSSATSGVEMVIMIETK
jgi:hypothetical protein